MTRLRTRQRGVVAAALCVGLFFADGAAVADGPVAWWRFDSAEEGRVAASEGSPVLNRALVILGWGTSGSALSIDGKDVAQGSKFRVGHRHGLEGSDLVVWIEQEATEPFEITLTPR